MSHITEHKLPPVIRVFISSTFSDMDHERSYFNEVLSPKLSRICAEHGVSFFCVDLRWGITEEQQIGGRVLPICLSEIDRCRPYFIGILGNRYGTIMETVPSSVVSSIPWLRGKEGKSITELEMLYAVLDDEQGDPASHSSFYFRDPALTESWYGPSEEDPHIRTLKNRIAQSPAATHSSYRSVEEFGELVMRDILAWCDKEFPVPEKATQIRRTWYDSELLRNYVPIKANHDFLDAYIRESHRSLLLHGTSERGKTTLLSAWNPPDGNKILINCGSDDTFRYWPMTLLTLIRELETIPEESISPDSHLTDAMSKGMASSADEKELDDGNLYFSKNRDLEDFRIAFLQWIINLKTRKPVYVVINDLNLDSDERTMMLSWIPVETNGSVQFICSTNQEESVEFAEIVGWNCKEMPPFTREHAATYLTNYLNIFGKSLSDTQTELLLNSPISSHAGHLRAVADFLINHGRFHNLDRLICDLKELPDHTALYPYLLEYFLNDVDEKTAAITHFVLALLLESPISLTEQECYTLTSRFVEITPLEWASVSSILEQLRVNKGDYWNLTGYSLRAAVSDCTSPEISAIILEVLADHFAQKVKEADENESFRTSHRQHAAWAKASLSLYAKADKNDKLLEALQSRDIMLSLCTMEQPALRAAWLHLIIDGNIDVEEELNRLFRSVISEYGKEHILTHTLASFFEDLELTDHVSDTERLSDGTIPGINRDDSDFFSPEFNQFMRVLLAKLDRLDMRSKINLLSETLTACDNFSPIESCQLLGYKADLEYRNGNITDMLSTVNHYFELALRSGNLNEFLQSMELRSRALHKLDRNQEALHLVDKLCSLYLSRGETRPYLACLNSKGNVLTALYRYRDAQRCFEQAHSIWIKLGKNNEANKVCVNLCNSMHLQGKDKIALGIACALYEKLNDGDGSSSLRAELAGNIGLYALGVKEYETAKSYLRIAMDLAEAEDRGQTFINAAMTFGTVCEKTGTHMAGYLVMERLMNAMWERGKYATVLDALNKACAFLRHCSHARQAKKVHQEWRKRFSTIEGGTEMFDSQMDQDTFDSRETDRCREALAMAKSTGDPLEIARANVALAATLHDEDPEEFRACMYVAAELFAANGSDSQLLEAIVSLLSDCFSHGKADDAYLKKILSYAKDPVVLTVSDIWLKLGSWDSEDEDKVNRTSGQSYEEILSETLPLASTHMSLVYACWKDLVPSIAKEVSVQTLQRMLHALPREESFFLEYAFEEAFTKDMLLNIENMKVDYQGPQTLRLLAYYEKAIEFLSEIGSANTGVLAGNIAIIYRRRKDEEKALHYHKISMDDYLRQGIPYDALVEKMNLSTAYREFGRKDEAISVLREALSEAKEKGITALVAAIAGNLAANLRDRGNTADHEEIMDCFAIEENYYREQLAARDLAISLLNQTAYGLMREDAASVSDKLAEARKIVRENNYTEFYQALAAMEATSARLNSTNRSTDGLDEETARAFFEELLATNGQFTVNRLYVEDDRWNADCFPLEQNQIFFTKLRLILMGSDNEVVFGAMFAPAQYNEAAKENLKAYVEWSNTLTFYEMTIIEGFTVQGVYLVRAASREDLMERFLFYLRLWMADCYAMSMLSIGMDLAFCQGLKLQILNMDADDTETTDDEAAEDEEN
ncbi:MAG: DUF4062 domain-containing protein [Ruminococcaceae bacterium]|nr:DUF4062 domain-containing protein [Oscillospiraceae bacterium]